MTPNALQRFVADELQQPVADEVRAFATHLAATGKGAAAVLFYGSNLRSGALDGVLDFYLLVDDLHAWHGHHLAALANRWLPPNVSYCEWQHAGHTLRAKLAVLTVQQFHAGMAGEGIDTTLWARFAQPAGLLWARDARARDAAITAVSAAVCGAARWAAQLGPPQGGSTDYWDALFARTYAAELRVEKAERAYSLAAHAPQRYATALRLAWAAAGIAWDEITPAIVRPAVADHQRQQATVAWARRARWGKALNLLRLVKSAWTFTGGADYLAWKVERHSGVKIKLSDWQRKHPILAAPYLLWRLKTLGAIR